MKTYTYKVGDKVVEQFDGTIIHDAEIVSISEDGKVRLTNSLGEQWRSNLVWLTPFDPHIHKSFQYKMMMRPFDIGTYPREGFMRLVRNCDRKTDGCHAILEYSELLTEMDLKRFELELVSDI